MSANPSAVATMGLRVYAYKADDATIVQCGGTLTAEHCEALMSEVKHLIPHSKRIILDLNEVTRMDSAGLGAIAGLYASAGSAGCEFVLINYNKTVRDLLKITNLLSVFEACARTGARFL